MSEPKQPYITAEAPDETTTEKLARLLGKPDRVNQLIDLLEEVITDTHYGCVRVVITDGRVTLIKIEKSYS